MNQEREEKLITFSSHSMSFKALFEVGFKQPNVVSDDSRIFWQCFLKYDGDYRVEPLYYPVSMDANVAKSFWRTLVNLYRQQRRWAYGVGDIPYFLFGFLKNKKIPLSKKFSLGLELFEGHISWAISSILIFLLGWMPIYIGGFEFSRSVISYSLTQIVSRIMIGAMLGVVASCYISLLLLPPKPPEYGRFKYVIFALSWLAFPFIMILFVSLPALDAQTRWMFGRYMGFWVTEIERHPKT
jgi:cellulose synthase/poly-beta-1,6-N-acetylglucosamine synthase-like glycosyltransferase